MSSDWELLELARNGDESAWKTMLGRHGQALLNMVVLITGSTASARDIVQDTFLRLIDRKEKNQIGSFKAFLSTISFRLALKEKQRAFKNVSLDGQDTLEHHPDPLHSVLRNERNDKVRHAIDALQEDHRMILVLRFYGGLNYKQIAQALNLPLGTVKSRIFYAVKSCRNDLQKTGITE